MHSIEALISENVWKKITYEGGERTLFESNKYIDVHHGQFFCTAFTMAIETVT